MSEASLSRLCSRKTGLLGCAIAALAIVLRHYYYPKKSKFVEDLASIGRSSQDQETAVRDPSFDEFDVIIIGGGECSMWKYRITQPAMV
jgi:hypothetical protein